MAGSEKYFKTIIKGVSAYYPDYIMIVIDTKKGLRETDAQHINLAFSYEKPVFFVMTKMDLVTEGELQKTESEIRQ